MSTRDLLNYNKATIRKYESYLSPFGRKVMLTLMNIKQERESKSKKAIIACSLDSRYQNKKDTRYSDAVTSYTDLKFHEVGTEDDINLQHVYYQLKNVILPFAESSSKDSLNIANNDNDDMIGSIEKSDVINKTNSLLKIHPQFPVNGKTDIDRSATNNITWDAIFDSELIEGLDVLNNKTNNKQNNNSKYSSFESDLTKVNKTHSKYLHTYESHEGNENFTEILPQETEPINNLSKKTKSVSKLKKSNNLRKEKFSKIVQNWLNNSEPINSKKEDCITHQQDVELDKRILIDSEKIKHKRFKEDTKQKDKTNKRTVQAQLANKDGVMKFKKPKMNNEGIRDIAKLASPCNDENINGKPEEFKKSAIIEAKDKKSKGKFLTPIKSQMPVRDVTYKVTIINDLNLNDFKHEIRTFKGAEVAITLVYSNGFCQLNSQHTDDQCYAESIMFYINDEFFYAESHLNDNSIEIIRNILTGNILITYDAKSTLIYLMHHFKLSSDGINILDTKIGTSLMSPDEPPESFSDVQKLLSLSAAYTISAECVLQKTAWYLTLLKTSATKMRTLLIENGLWKVFADIEMRILPIIADMEQRGICIDVTKLKSMESTLLTRMKEIEMECHKAAGKPFQINSTVQVRNILYDELKLDTKTNIKIRETICKGEKSTSETMLRPLAAVHPLPKLILEYRHLHKAHATFLAGIAEHVRNGVVRPTWNQTAAATGRIGSSNPNLQAIPKTPFDLVLYPMENNEDKHTLNFRSIYVARAGYTLLAADFKHIECRVFAEAAADEGLLSALQSPDLFTVLAAKWLNKPEAEVSGADRERTKRIVYSSLYGAGARKLMDILNIGYDEVFSIMTSFNRTFPSLKSFARSVVKECEARGRLATCAGRARSFTDICSSDFAAKSHAERQAINFIIQGTAADLCKTAMVLSTEGLRQFTPGLDTHLLLQIHDELVWEVLDLHLDNAAVIIKSAMENCGRMCGMTQILPVAMYRGKNWGEMEEFTLKLQ